ncbi:Ecdysone receptor [Gryllus bimaculatus]|nr:Ecdysone receptor [Gryllus bimaculatus]
MTETPHDNDLSWKLTKKKNGFEPMHDEIVHGLKILHCQYNQLSDSDIEKIRLAGSLNIRHRLSYNQRVYAFMFMVTQLIDFCKRLPGFDKLYRDDQVALIKNCVNRVLLLRLVETYDADSETIYFAERPYTQDNFYVLDMGIPTVDMFGFCRQMHDMKVDSAGYALLTAITIFSG